MIDWNLILTIATVVLSIVSVIIAICSARSTSKDAAKQIHAMQDLIEQQSTTTDVLIYTEMVRIQSEIMQTEYESKQKLEAINARRGRNLTVAEQEASKLEAKTSAEIKLKKALLDYYKEIAEQ